MLFYLIKSSLVLAILLTFYKLILERESIHVFKRAFLLLSLVVAFGIPLITFTQYVEVPTQIVNQTIESHSTATLTSNEQPFEIKTNYLPSIIWSIYSIGVFLFGLKFIINLAEISRKIKRNEKIKNKGFTNVLLKNLTTPHTFFNYLFFNKTKFEAQQIPKEVFIHEQAHARQKHSLDILFIEVLRVIFWFNPLLYFLKKSIKLNHEFLADTSVLKEKISIQSYQKTLLEYSSNTESNILANAINYSLIKKRFTIMKKQTSKKSVWIRTFLLLPILVLLLYSFSSTKLIQKEKSISVEKIKNKIENINDLEITNVKKDTTGYKTINNKTYVFQIKNGITRYWDMKGNGVDEKGILLPELPNISKDATTKQLREYEIAKKQYVEKHQTTIENVTTNDGEKIQIVEVFESPKKKHATLEQLKEYNKLAKKYNSKSGSNIIIKVKEINRIRKLYNLMSTEQKQNAEAYPVFPPTPPIKYENPMRVSKRFYSYTNNEGKEIKVELQYDLSLPPPPPTINATKSAKKNYQITLKKYQEWDKTMEIIKNSSENKLPNIPPPPPKSQLDHIIGMAKKNADFYLENKKITSDKAIDIIKNSEKMNILTKKIDSKKPQVFISAQPIP